MRRPGSVQIGSKHVFRSWAHACGRSLSAPGRALAIGLVCVIALIPVSAAEGGDRHPARIVVQGGTTQRLDTCPTGAFPASYCYYDMGSGLSASYDASANTITISWTWPDSLVYLMQEAHVGIVSNGYVAGGWLGGITSRTGIEHQDHSFSSHTWTIGGADNSGTFDPKQKLYVQLWFWCGENLANAAAYYPLDGSHQAPYCSGPYDSDGRAWFYTVAEPVQGTGVGTSSGGSSGGSTGGTGRSSGAAKPDTFVVVTGPGAMMCDVNNACGSASGRFGLVEGSTVLAGTRAIQLAVKEGRITLSPHSSLQAFGEGNWRLGGISDQPKSRYADGRGKGYEGTAVFEGKSYNVVAAGAAVQPLGVAIFRVDQVLTVDENNNPLEWTTRVEVERGKVKVESGRKTVMVPAGYQTVASGTNDNVPAESRKPPAKPTRWTP